MRISDWSSDVCSSDLVRAGQGAAARHQAAAAVQREELRQAADGEITEGSQGFPPMGAEEAVGAVLDQGEAVAVAEGPQPRSVLRKPEVVDGNQRLAAAAQPGLAHIIVDAEIQNGRA